MANGLNKEHLNLNLNLVHHDSKRQPYYLGIDGKGEKGERIKLSPGSISAEVR